MMPLENSSRKYNNQRESVISYAFVGKIPYSSTQSQLYKLSAEAPAIFQPTCFGNLYHDADRIFQDFGAEPVMGISHPVTSKQYLSNPRINGKLKKVKRQRNPSFFKR